jgi:phage-related protein
MTIYGTGTVGVKVNGVLACTLTITDNITLDCEEQEAYKGTIATSQNRQMVGDFPVFVPGVNVLTFTGTVTEVKTIVRSRWL